MKFGIIKLIMFSWSNYSETALEKGHNINKNETRSGVIENFHNHTVAHPTNEEGEPIKNKVR